MLVHYIDFEPMFLGGNVTLLVISVLCASRKSGPTELNESVLRGLSKNRVIRRAPPRYQGFLLQETIQAAAGISG